MRSRREWPLPPLEQEIRRNNWNVQRILLLAGLAWIAIGVATFVVLTAVLTAASTKFTDEIPRGIQWIGIAPIGIGLAHVIVYLAGGTSPSPGGARWCCPMQLGAGGRRQMSQVAELQVGHHRRATCFHQGVQPLVSSCRTRLCRSLLQGADISRRRAGEFAVSCAPLVSIEPGSGAERRAFHQSRHGQAGRGDPGTASFSSSRRPRFCAVIGSVAPWSPAPVPR